MLKGKVAIVTGGTRGIGYATVKTFLDNGAKVALLGSRQETVEKALKQLKQENSSYKVKGYWPNLMSEAEVKGVFEEVLQKWGKIDILVNNAGVSASDSIYDYKVADFEKTIDINVNAVFIASHAVVKYMKKKGGGVILNTSSVVSLYAQSSGSAYPASKFAVNGLTKALARELGKDNIRVNAVAPGVIRTDMVDALPSEVVQSLAGSIPLGRVGEAQDIANAFLYLASDLASYVTGEVLSVDGAIII